jgi:hypothetical protein
MIIKSSLFNSDPYLGHAESLANAQKREYKELSFRQDIRPALPLMPLLSPIDAIVIYKELCRAALALVEMFTL